MVGAQFWVSYVPCESQRLNAVQLTIEQIDLIKRLIEQYPEDLRLATSADDITLTAHLVITTKPRSLHSGGTQNELGNISKEEKLCKCN
ncbi:Dipeptidase 3 [Portunus trituberculatus]|uniref:Dipeptidase n=1 Tax=Portunus trituberculatus TaxID=210409 RepID=A0A5B7EEW4_PORTR|nr:Dipeptidase 3 [Portunus trituberculatus]